MGRFLYWIIKNDLITRRRKEKKGNVTAIKILLIIKLSKINKKKKKSKKSKSKSKSKSKFFNYNICYFFISWIQVYTYKKKYNLIYYGIEKN